MSSLEAMRPHRLLEIENFFRTYKTLEKRPTEVTGWLGLEEAWRIIDDAFERGAQLRSGEAAATAEPGTWR